MPFSCGRAAVGHKPYPTALRGKPSPAWSICLGPPMCLLSSFPLEQEAGETVTCLVVKSVLRVFLDLIAD